MLNKFSQFIERHLHFASDASEQAPLTEQQKQLAFAALLVEVATADHEFDDAELKILMQALEQKFLLSHEQQAELTELAKSKSADATSLHQFTHLINRDCAPGEKFALIKSMWEVAYADGNLDKYEEYVIRKVADLIYVSHSDFIRAKSLVKTTLEAAQ